MRKEGKAMTNATIIFNAACELLKQGILKPSGRLLMKKLPDGSLIEVPEPETIHTYNGCEQRKRQPGGLFAVGESDLRSSSETSTGAAPRRLYAD